MATSHCTPQHIVQAIALASELAIQSMRGLWPDHNRPQTCGQQLWSRVVCRVDATLAAHSPQRAHCRPTMLAVCQPFTIAFACVFNFTMPPEAARARCIDCIVVKTVTTMCDNRADDAMACQQGYYLTTNPTHVQT